MPKKRRISRKILNSVLTMADDSLINLADRREPTGVRALFEGGLERFEVVFGDPDGRRQLITFTPLHRRDLCAGFAEAFYNWGVDKAAATRTDKKRFLDAFFDFLADREARSPIAPRIVAVRQIDTSILNQYVAWLDEPKLHSRGKRAGQTAPWAVKSRCMHLSIVSQMITWIKENRRSSLPDECEVPWAPWPTATQKTEPTKILTPQSGRRSRRARLPGGD